MTGQTVWSTPRKGRVLYDAVQWRKAGGSVPKLALKRKEEDVDWPSNNSVRRWLQHYDTLKKRSPQKSERELLDEASRSGRTYPVGHRAKISGGILDEMADGIPTIHGKPREYWMEKTKASKSVIKRLEKQILTMPTVENRPPGYRTPEPPETSRS
jgi:hypothetical protein